jgi:ABC-type transport system substrate-binding protein
LARADTKSAHPVEAGSLLRKSIYRTGVLRVRGCQFVDDPDQTFYETYACGSENNPDGYCNPDIDKLIDRQSIEFDQEKRERLVWKIERRLAEDGARPIIYHTRAATCRQPYVKSFVSMVFLRGNDAPG